MKGQTNMKNEKYESPVIEIVIFQANDILTTSSAGFDTDPDYING